MFVATTEAEARDRGWPCGWCSTAVGWGFGIPLYDFGDDSGSDWDEAGPSRSARFLDAVDLTGWGHGCRSKRVVRKVDFSAATDLFGVSALWGVGGGLGGVGAGDTVLAPGSGGVVQVAPALPLTPKRASPVGGEGRGARAAVEDVDMDGMGLVGVVPASGMGGGGCGCDCGAVLAGVWREVASQVRRMRGEVMGAIGLLLAERGLGTWEEGRRLENTRGRLERERAAAQREHEVMKVAERVSAEAERRVTREREAAAEVEAAAKRQGAVEEARDERLAALRKNLDVAAESMRSAKTDAERSAGCEAVAVAHDEVKRVEAVAPVSPEVGTAGPWSAVGGVVTRKVEVVTRLNGPVGRARTAELKGVVEIVQPLVWQRGHASWAVLAVVWTEHGADEILWRVTGAGKDTIDEVVRSALVDDVSAVVGGRLLRDSWVEDRLSKYVVGKNVPEA